MLNSKSYLFDVDRNPVVRALLHQTFYKQFCVGESRIGVQDAMQQMRSCGYTDIILEYALEVLKGEEEDAEAAVERWRTGLLATVEMASPGSFVGLKWSGLGSAALQLLKEQKPPTPSMDSAMRQLCDAAAAKNVSLLPAAEESDTNPTYHSWSLNLQRIYNRSPSTQFDRPVIYNTYQAYLRSTPDLLSFHLADAKAHEYTLAVKLVRGAYLHSEPKHLVHSCKEDTDSAYDTLAANLLKQQYGGILRPLDGTLASFPKVAVVLATHNANSVHKAQKLRNVQLSQDPHANLPNLCYAQLQGMADEISCELVQASKTGLEAGAVGEEGAIDPPKVYKCTTWGSMRECLNYLLRRAAENKDAAGRTKATRQAMAAELMRRIKARIGLKAN
ncbi:MAG: proline dehydrogenase [Bathelium mastoideum]|nr:MAG: proline dehydrogenase [Bathelium mastoideum]